jgi:hypothetical protein
VPNLAFFNAILLVYRRDHFHLSSEEISRIGPEVRKAVFGDKVALRYFRLDRSVFGNERAIGVASAFEGFLGFAF